MGEGALRANLIIHYGGADIFDQTIKFIHTGSAVQEFRDLPQWDELPENLVEFPSGPHRHQVSS